MSIVNCDLLVLGGGPGGISAATKSALAGKKVIIINDGPLMGYGIEGAFRTKSGYEITQEYLHIKQRKEVYGEVKDLSLAGFYEGIEQSAQDLTRMLKDRLDKLKIQIINERGEFVDKKSIKAGDHTYVGEAIVIATGTKPRMFDGIPNSECVLTSDDAIEFTDMTGSLLILGAGVIGCEFACMFNALGVEVHLVDTKPQIMSNEDADVSHFLKETFETKGINIIPSSRFESMAITVQGRIKSILSTTTVETDRVLLAVGRSACSTGFNLECTGVVTDKYGYISVDQNMQTNIPGIYAVGDVGYRSIKSDLSLVHVAEAEGRCAASHFLGENFTQNMEYVPYIIFTDPLLAGAGMSETQARDEFGDVRIGKYPYARNHRAHTARSPLGFIKLIVGPEGDDRILGVRAIGPSADSIVGAAAILVERQLPYTYLIDTIFPHPSLLESLKGAAHIIKGDALAYEAGEEVKFSDLLSR